MRTDGKRDCLPSGQAEKIKVGDRAKQTTIRGWLVTRGMGIASTNGGNRFRLRPFFPFTTSDTVVGSSADPAGARRRPPLLNEDCSGGTTRRAPKPKLKTRNSKPETL
jgi:hypothetical protein